MNETIHGVYENIVNIFPGKVAVEHRNKKVSYKNLNQNANQLGWYILDKSKTLFIENNIKYNSIVVCLSPSIERIISIIGVLKAGFAYVPLDGDQPLERLNYIIKDTNSQIIITERKYLTYFLKINIDKDRIFCWEDDILKLSKLSKSNIDTIVSSNDMAYIIYTSGTTGQPKGVMIEHHSVVNLVKDNIYFPIEVSDRIGHAANFSFDASTFEIWGALLNGAVCHIIDKEVLTDISLLIELFQSKSLSIIFITTALLNAIIDINIKAFAILRLLYFGGELVNCNKINKLIKEYRNISLNIVHIYGPTENTTFSLFHVINKNKKYINTIPIGRSITGTEFQILKINQDSLIESDEGELYLLGKGLARGYLNQPALTSKQFVEYNNKVFYKTGDWVRLNVDGEVEYINRIDAQVKIRGFRVELEEIESLLNKYDLIKHACVCYIKISEDNGMLIAFTINSVERLDQKDINDYLKKHLPSYMIPQKYISLKSFPLTANGKINKLKLCSDFKNEHDKKKILSPVSSQVKAMINAWQEIFRLDYIDQEDNFFEIGGHSLLAMRLVNHIKTSHQLNCTIQDIFNYPVLSDFARYVYSKENKDQVNQLQDLLIRKYKAGDMFPLTRVQQRLWFLHYFTGETTAHYNICFAFKINGSLNTAYVAQTWNYLLKRHNILRMSIVNVAGEIRQVVNAFETITLNAEEISRKVLEETLTKESLFHFDLSIYPLWRIKLYKIFECENEHVFFISLHHILCDGWSFALLVNEFNRYYAMLCQQSDQNDNKGLYQYSDYALWENKTKQSYAKELEYWQYKLKNYTQLRLHAGKLYNTNYGHAGETYYDVIDEIQLQEIKKFNLQHNTTLFAFLLTCVSLVIYHHTLQNDFVIGIPIANRHQKKYEKIVGCFINTIPIRILIDDYTDILSLLRDVSDTCLEAYENQAVPYEMIVDAIARSSNSRNDSLFNVLCALQNAGEINLELPDAACDLIDIQYKTSKFPLTFNFVEHNSTLKINLEYMTDIFSHVQIRGFVDFFKKIVATMLTDHSSQIRKILSMKFSNAIPMCTISNTNAQYKSIVELFQLKVKEYGDHIAVKDGKRNITYKELDQMSNQLAHYIKEYYLIHLRSPVTNNTLIALSIQTSLDLIVTMMGVLKTGAAYLPIDPNYPFERKKYYIENSHSELVISTSQYIKDFELIGLAKYKIINWSTEKKQLDRYDKSPIRTVYDLAYVIYTSGSTGNPKGVVIQHTHLVELFDTCKTIFDFRSDDKWSLFHSFSFDFSVWEIWGALINGATLVIVPYLTARSPELFLKFLQREKISILNQTPSAFKRLLDIDCQKNARLTHLRYIIFGGEALNMLYVDHWWKKYEVNKPYLINMYGITEITIHATYLELNKSHLNSSFNGSPIGKMLRHLHAVILDQKMNLVPINESGELYICGLSVAKEYLNNTNLTEQRFIQYQNHRLYKTGDKVRLLNDGDLEYLGRIDNQIKLRGYRIELGEIEQSLNKHSDIQESIVLVHHYEGLDQLIAFILLHQDALWDEKSFRIHVQQYLPDFMLPNKYFRIFSIPLTLNGKIDKVALLNNIKSERNEKVVNDQNHLTKIEKQLLSIWQSLFLNKKINVNDNFFALGGDSIISIQLINRAKINGLNISIKELFSNPTINELAKVVKVRNVRRSLHAKETKGDVALTPIQKWFFSLNLMNPNHFNQSVILQSSKKWNKKILNAAINSVVSYHDMFRAKFKKPSMQYLTEPNPKQNVDIQGISLTKIAIHQQDEYLKNEYEKLQKQIDIFDGPLYKFANVIGHYSNKEYLVIIIHHLIIDGVSWRIFIEDLNTSYDNLINGKEPIFPEKTCSYQAWSKSLLTYNAKIKSAFYKNDFLASKDYFVSLYSNYKKQPTFGECEIVELNLDWHNANDIISNLYSLFEIKVSYILLGGLLLAFNKWKNVENVFIDLESHGRENILKNDVSRTIGWFTTIYPVLLSGINDAQNPLMENVISIAKKAMDDLQSNGFKYSILSQLDSAYISKDINYGERPAVGFNFLGSFENLNTDETHFQLTLETAGENISFDNQLLHLIDVSALILNKNLKINIYFSAKHFTQNEINELSFIYIKAIEDVMAYWQNKITNTNIKNYKYFPLNQQDYNKLSYLGDVEDIYPLTSLQSGMLFHTISQENHSQYFTQVYWRLGNEIDESIYKKTWSAIINKYSILRSVFYWDNESQPFQLILSVMHMDWYNHDWNNISSDNLEEELNKFLRNDRSNPFNLKNPPLLRFHWIQLSNGKKFFIFDHHHLLLDGWSLNIILSDVQRIYEKIQHNNYEIEETASYSNYIDWYSKQDKNIALKFWKRHLKDIQSSTKLPLYSAINSLDNYIPSTHIEQYYKHLDEHKKTKYLNFVKENSTTLNVLFQLAWSVLLKKYTGQDNIIYGTVISGRSIYLPHIQNIVGMLINTVPVIVKFSSNIKISQQLRDMHQFIGQVNEYNYLGLKDIQALSKIFSSENLISHLFVFENYPNHLQDYNNAFFTDIAGHEQTNYSFCFIVGIEKGITLKVIYDKDYILPAYVERMCVHFTTILDSIVGDPNQLIKDIKYLLRDSLYYNKKSKYTDNIKSRNNTILEIFDDFVKKQPLAIAIIHDNTEITYQDLDQRSSVLSMIINDKINNNIEVDTSNFIAVCISSTLNFIISILAVLKSGCAYVPLSSAMPALRLNKIIKQVDCKLIIIEKCYESKFETSAIQKCLMFDYEDCANVSKSSKGLSSIALKNDNLAYLIFTSGSTGEPKGVMINQSSIIELVKDNDMIIFDNTSRLLQTADHAFDATTFEIWGTLLNGGTLVTINKEMLLDKIGFESCLINYDITHLWLTSALLDYHVSLNPGVFKKLKYLIAGGEALNFATIKTILHSNDKPAHLINGYGPTECTTFTTFHEITIKDIQYHSIPIGKPRNGVECFVLNKQYELLPSGVIGELYVAGNCLSVGYYNNPRLSDEKFIKNTTNSSLPSIIYKTGDYVCSLDDGTLIYLGRLDNQVKIRGYLVEINEIEECLNKHPFIAKAIIVAKKIKAATTIFAFVKCIENITAREINDYLLIRLSEYMLPHNYQFIEEFPFTNNGKIDRDKLLKACDAILEKKNTIMSDNFNDKYTDSLRKIWGTILNKTDINIHDRFFDAGGHSLLYLKLITAINKHFDRYYPISWCFKNNTIHTQANSIRADESLHSFRKIVEFKKGENSIPLIFIHPGFGGVEVYHGLSQLLSPSVTFYGLDSYNLFSGQTPIDSIEKLAEYYINVLSEHLPGNKCILGGWSLGGVIAYEMAQQLKHSHIEVVSVILLDSFIWTSNKELSLLDINLILDPILLKHNLSDIKTIPEVISAEIRAIRSYYPISPSQGIEIVLLKASRFNIDELNNQPNKSDDFKNHLYQLFKDPYNGWQSIVKNLQTFNLNETHDNFLSENNIIYIAQIINELMKYYESRFTNKIKDQLIPVS